MTDKPTIEHCIRWVTKAIGVTEAWPEAVNAQWPDQLPTLLAIRDYLKAQQGAADALMDCGVINIDDKTFKDFQSALDAPPKDNPKLCKLLAITPVWER